jgi:hypothetical protein
MSSKLSQIFQMRKTTFDAPSINATTGSFEQECLFIEVSEAKSRASHGRIRSEVNGSIIVYCQVNKMPYGYFHKRIEQSEADLKKDFFFYDIDLNPANSPARLQNILERRVRFVYLFSEQYDPDHGELTSLEI